MLIPKEFLRQRLQFPESQINGNANSKKALRRVCLPAAIEYRGSIEGDESGIRNPPKAEFDTPGIRLEWTKRVLPFRFTLQNTGFSRCPPG